MKGDVPCVLSQNGYVFHAPDGNEPHDGDIPAVAIPLAQREVEEKLMRVGLESLDAGIASDVPGAMDLHDNGADTPALADLRAKLEANT